MAGKVFTTQDVAAIAALSHIPVSDEEKQSLAKGFTTTMEVAAQLFTVDVAGVEPTHQVTNLENVFREDTVDQATMLTQDQALSAAPRSHNGFFVVNQIREEK